MVIILKRTYTTSYTIQSALALPPSQKLQQREQVFFFKNLNNTELFSLYTCLMETEDGSLQKTVTSNKTFSLREERGPKAVNVIPILLTHNL